MKAYSFLDTLLLINGFPISGFGDDDTTIEVKRLADSASHKMGTDGEMTLSLSANLSGEIIFRLMQTSTDNGLLSTLISNQESGTFVPIFAEFKDVRGGDLGSGTLGYIPRPADLGRGETAKSQEWRVVVERLDLLHLGVESF